jgi:hypothetical protein
MQSTERSVRPTIVDGIAPHGDFGNDKWGEQETRLLPNRLLVQEALKKVGLLFAYCLGSTVNPESVLLKTD